MSEEVWEVWGDSRPTMNKAEQRKVLDYVKKRGDAGLQACPYSREAKKKLYCKIFGKRCFWNGDYVDCESFEEYFLENERVKDENKLLENLSPVGDDI